MNKLLVVAVLGCFGLSACEQKLPDDSSKDSGHPASEAKPVYVPTPWQEPGLTRRGANHSRNRAVDPVMNQRKPRSRRLFGGGKGTKEGTRIGRSLKSCTISRSSNLIFRDISSFVMECHRHGPALAFELAASEAKT